METGTVTNIVVSRGFGFIRRDGGKGDAFFHFKSVDDGLPFDETLLERRVRFDVQTSDRGLRAVNVCAAT
jgi:CspA family cold shock protein